MIPEETVLNFAASLFKSVWALELLFVLKRDPARAWRREEMIRELRSSQVVVTEGLNNLLLVGLAIEAEAGLYQYQPGSPALDEMVSALEKIYAVKPAAVVREIVTSPNRKLQILSDAFRFKE
jgi:hypothetical protein